MLVRITRRLSNSIDGMHLSRFVPGQVYDVGTSVGSYLLAMGAAEPTADDSAEPPQSASERVFAGDRDAQPQSPADLSPADRAHSDEKSPGPALPRATAADRRTPKKKR